MFKCFRVFKKQSDLNVFESCSMFWEIGERIVNYSYSMCVVSCMQCVDRNSGGIVVIRFQACLRFRFDFGIYWSFFEIFWFIFIGVWVYKIRSCFFLEGSVQFGVWVFFSVVVYVGRVRCRCQDYWVEFGGLSGQEVVMEFVWESYFLLIKVEIV